MEPYYYYGKGGALGRRGTHGSGGSKAGERYAGVGQARNGIGRARRVVNFDKKSAKILIFFVKNTKIFERAFGARIFLTELFNQIYQARTSSKISNNVNDYIKKKHWILLSKSQNIGEMQKNRLKMH